MNEVYFIMPNLHSISEQEGFQVLTKVLTMSSLISIDEEEGVTRVNEAGALRTVRDMDALTVSSYQEAVNITWTRSARQTSRTFAAWDSKCSVWTWRVNISLMNKNQMHSE